MKDPNHIFRLQKLFSDSLAAYLNSRKLPADSIFRNLRQYIEIRKGVPGLKPKLKYTEEDAVELLCFIYSDLKLMTVNDLYQELTIKVTNTFDYHNFQKSGYKYHLINEIRDNLKKVEHFIESAIVHGSFATGDLIENWSDLDFVLILKDEVFNKKTNLLTLRKNLIDTQFLFRLIDPLSHHFFQFQTQANLNHYSEFNLPLESYKLGLSMLGNDTITFKVIDSKEEVLDKIKKLLNHFSMRLIKPAKNIYELKHDLSHILLLPSFFLEGIGVYPYKKESFELAKTRFKNLDFGAVEITSGLRVNWPDFNWLKYYPINLMPRFASRFSVLLSAKLISHRSTDKIISEIGYRDLISSTIDLIKKYLNDYHRQN